MAQGDNTIFWVAVAGLAAFGVAYTFIPSFKNQVRGIFGGTFTGGGTAPTKDECADLCKRRVCSTYLSQCGSTGCTACSNCGKLCSAAQCTTLRAQGCSVSACPTCAKALGVIQTVSPNCTKIGPYTVWKSKGCLNGRVGNYEYASIGTCDQIRAQFLIRYKCGAKVAREFGDPWQSVSVA